MIGARDHVHTTGVNLRRITTLLSRHESIKLMLSIYTEIKWIGFSVKSKVGVRSVGPSFLFLGRDNIFLNFQKVSTINIDTKNRTGDQFLGKNRTGDKIKKKVDEPLIFLARPYMPGCILLFLLNKIYELQLATC